MNTFAEAFTFGRTGEQDVARVLQANGWYIVPSYDYSGTDRSKAPRLQGSLKSYVIPDLDVSREGERVWVEVKTKTEASFTRITGRLEHGIPKRHAEDYLRVQEITGCRVFLVIVERSTGDYLCASIDRLMESARVSDLEGPMVYFARDSFGCLR